MITEEALSLIRAKRPTSEIHRHAVEPGMMTLRAEGSAKMHAAITPVEGMPRVTRVHT